MDTIRINDDTSRVELEQALTNLNHRAQREYPVVGSTGHPTPWDRRHAQINAVLDDWQHANT